MEQALVSIIIPTFNSEKHLAETIKSAMGQTWEHKEIIIVDDGSTDRSLHIAHQFSNENLKIISQKNSGAAAARNAGLKIAKGEFIQFLDADDLLSPQKIKSQITALKGKTDAVAISTSIHFFENEDHLSIQPAENELSFLISTEDIFDFLMNIYGKNGNGGIIPIHSWLTNKSIIDSAGIWNEQLSVDDDGEYFCRVALKSKKIIYVPEAIAFYRKFNSKNNLSAQTSLTSKYSSFNALCLKEKHLSKIKDDPAFRETFATSYYKLGVECYPLYRKLSKACILKAKDLNPSYHKKDLFIGSKTINYIANHISWKLVRIAQYMKHKRNK